MLLSSLADRKPPALNAGALLGLLQCMVLLPPAQLSLRCIKLVY
jgi:hypothetical protein